MCIPKVSKEQGFTSSSAPHWVGKELQEPTGSDKTNDGKALYCILSCMTTA